MSISKKLLGAVSQNNSPMVKMLDALRAVNQESSRTLTMESLKPETLYSGHLSVEAETHLGQAVIALNEKLKANTPVAFGQGVLSMESLRKFDEMGGAAAGHMPSMAAEGSLYDTEDPTAAAAAVLAGSLAMSNESMRMYMQQTNAGFSHRKAHLGEDLVVVQGSPSGDHVDQSKWEGLSMESYDETAVTTTKIFSQAYALSKGGQEPALEMFFPTVLVSPDESGYGVSIPLIQIHEDAKHKLDGKQTDFKFRHIVHAFVHEELLRDDTTKIIPVWRDVYKHWFVDAAVFTPQDKEQGDELVKTAPLAIGQEANLVKVCQNAAFLETGTADITDTLDPGLHLENLYLRIGNETIRLPVRNLDGSNWYASPQDLQRVEVLAFNSKVVQLRGKIETVTGAESTELADLATNGIALRLGLHVTGRVELDTGAIVVNSTDPKVDSATVNAERVSLENPVVAPLVAKLKDAKIVGYDIHGFLANANRRQRGQLINTRYYTQLYPVKKRSPVSAIRSQMVDGSTSEATDITNLLATCSIRMTNSAIDKLLEADSLLHAYVDNEESLVNAPRVLGIAHHVVGSFYEREVIDVEAELMTRNSTDKTRDMQAVLVNRLRDGVVRAHAQTAYSAATRVIFGNAEEKPLVMVLTDPIIGNYLMLHGDLRTLGAGFDLRVGTTLNLRIRGKMFATFGLKQALNSGQPNPMHFGSAGFRPELVVQLPTYFNGANSNQITVYPNYEHNVNLPILLRYDVINIPESVVKRTPLNVYLKKDDDQGGDDDGQGNGG